MKTIISTIPKLAWELSDHSIFKSLILSSQLCYFYISRFYVSNLGDFTLNIPVSGKRKLFTLKHVLDVAGLAEAFVDKDYEIKTSKDITSILDLGGHIGDTALYWRKRYPDAKIVVVEPSSKTLEYLRKNFSADINVQIIQGALATEAGEMELQLTKNPMGHSLKVRTSQIDTENIQTFSLADICRLSQVDRFDIIKFDIEGGEDALLDIDPKLFGQTYVGEIHLDLLQGITLDSYKNTFKESTVSFSQTKHPKRYIMRAIYA
ncbi:MAG: hypothetical protein RLZZ360_447 [Candidatus Parcubacteria bacterium]